VDSDSLVPHLVPFKGCRTGLMVRAETLAVDEFLLQVRPEAFHHSVAVAVAGTAHALRHAMLLEKSWAGMTCILHTAPSECLFWLANSDLRSSNPQIFWCSPRIGRSLKPTIHRKKLIIEITRSKKLTDFTRINL